MQGCKSDVWFFDGEKNASFYTCTDPLIKRWWFRTDQGNQWPCTRKLVLNYSTVIPGTQHHSHKWSHYELSFINTVALVLSNTFVDVVLSSFMRTRAVPKFVPLIMRNSFIMLLMAEMRLAVFAF